MNPELEKRRRRRRLKIACLCLGRRLLALLLCFVMCLTLLPLRFSAFASETTENTDAAEPTGSTEATAPSGSAEPTEPAGITPPAVIAERTVTASEEAPASNGVNMTNTYLLEVSTGNVRNNGSVENVKYFVIYYTTGTGANTKTRSAVIFPGKDGMSKSMDAASQVANRNSRRNRVEEVFGYTTPALRDRDGLGSLHTDQFLFTTPEPIETVDRIQIFGELEKQTAENGQFVNAASTWACQGMRIARVDKLYGLEMYGWYSDDGYIDYKGEIIADVVMNEGGGIFHWNTSAGVFNIVGPGVTSGVGVTLVNTQTAVGYNKPNYVGTQHDSQVTSRVVFRMDLADSLNAGFECLAGSYAAGANSSVSSLKLCEAASVRIRYEDVYGCIREVNLPLIVNALGWTMEKLGGDNNGNVAICGYAQQGDSIPLSAMLPDFKRIAWTTSTGSDSQAFEISMGEAKAREKTHIVSVDTADQAIRPGRITKADNETVSFLCTAFYKDVSVKIEHDSAMLRYSFLPGAQEPGLSYTSGSVEGVRLDASTENKISMIQYREGMKLVPVDRRELYLITISTDNVEIAGTLNDVSIQFTYKNMRDKVVSSDDFNIRDQAQQFYGEWPGSVEDFAYKYGMRSSGTIQFLVPLANVVQFQSVSVKVNGTDEWQFKGISIRLVNSYSTRFARWEELSAELPGKGTVYSHLRISRTVNAKPACFKIGTVYEDGKPPVDPDDPAWQAGNLVQDDGMYHEFNGQSQEVSAYEPFDWSEYRYYMTYEDTLQDLGFDKTRCDYEVTVKVAGDKVNATDDDCGSGNLFYFQLLFENGKSGCVLANQQLQSDAFRTGAEATFHIPTTQDYGDLTSIRIIPDDQDSNSDIYDKLKIEYITVRRQTTGMISPTWTADSDSMDGLGWVGIDYRDQGAAGSARGAIGRSISEFSHTFEINKTSYSTKLLISISTGAYASELKPDANGEMVQLNDPILEAGMTMSYHYVDYDGRTRAADPLDIIHKMNEYSGLQDNKSRILDGVKEELDFCVSDHNYQFRPGKTDNFYIDVDNIHQLVDMQLQIRSSVVTKWNITNVSVYLVQGQGTRYINNNGEYDYKYPAGQELLFRASWNQPSTLTKDVQIYRKASGDANSIAGDTSIATVNITFNENEFPFSDDTWASTVAREPNTKDDSLNLFIYPSMDSSASDPESYGLSAEVLYTNTMTHAEARVKAAELTMNEDSSGRPVFYALGLNASYFESFSSVDVKTTSVRPVHVPISYAVMQRIRSGVLIESYYLMGAGNADNGISLHAATDPGGQNVQRAMLQLSANTPVQKLTPDEKDLAVAVYFYTDDAYGRELRSKYVYLTDMGYDTIYPGQVVELDFSIMNLKEITGFNVVTMGRLDIGIDRGEVLEQNANSTVLGKWSFSERMTPTRTPTRVNTHGLVTLLDLDFKTALSEGTVNSGATGPIQMTVGYLDETGNEYSEVFDDIRLFITKQTCFQAGDTDHIRLLIQDMAELRWIKLEPLSEPGAIIDASWKLDSLSTMVDFSGLTVSRTVNQLIVEHEALTISLADILLAGTIAIIHSPAEQGNAAGDYTIPTGGGKELVLNIGEGVRIVPRLQGSKQGVTVTLNRYDPTNGALGQAELVDTRGYTYAVLEANAQAAEAKGYTEEAAVWRSVIPDEGYWQVIESSDPVSGRTDTDAIIFVPPHNYTSSAMSYRITLSSRENDAATVYVTLSVPPESNPVDALIAEARGSDQQTANHVHSIVPTQAVEATCVHEGNIAYYSCAGCGKYFRDALGTEEIPDLALTVVPALGHNWGVWQTSAEPTCTQAGSRYRTCGRCGETETEPINALGHDWSDWISEGEYGHSRTCARCGQKDGEAHSFDEVVTPPTTTEQGYTTYTCKVCGYSYKGNYTDPIPTDPTEPTEPTEAAPVEPDGRIRKKEGDDDV